ncbi:MAG: PfkB family carbohydrate kinase [Bryobacteraceae bacterium]
MTLDRILAAFPKMSALVIGDICLDRWCTYDPALAEPSRETGLPRVAVTSTEVTPGAGGTVASNLAALGVGRVEVLGVMGGDGFGVDLCAALDARGIGSGRLLGVPGLQTFTYTKLINARTGVEDLPRLDIVNARPLEPSVERPLLDSIQSAVDDFDVILIADQAETGAGGAITPAVRELLTDLAFAYADKVFFADSRNRIEQFRRVIVKPNQQEAETACQKLFGRIDYVALRKCLDSRLLLVTHGPRGVLLVDDAGERWVETRAAGNPVDICGAGDSFSAGAAMALAVTGSPDEAARFGNLVAGVTIMKKGTGTASPEELLAAG